MRPEDEVLAVAGYDRWHCTRKMYLAIHTIMNDQLSTCNSEANSFAIGNYQRACHCPYNDLAVSERGKGAVLVRCEQIEGRALTCFEGHMG